MLTISGRGLSENLGLFFFTQPAIKTCPFMKKESKEDLKMKNFIKFAAVGLAGYFVGFYEMRYKFMKTMLVSYAEAENDLVKESKEDSKEEES